MEQSKIIDTLETYHAAIATRGPAVSQVSAEHYFEEVLEGARLIEAQCSKSIMFE